MRVRGRVYVCVERGIVLQTLHDIVLSLLPLLPLLPIDHMLIRIQRPEVVDYK